VHHLVADTDLDHLGPHLANGVFVRVQHHGLGDALGDKCYRVGLHEQVGGDGRPHKLLRGLGEPLVELEVRAYFAHVHDALPDSWQEHLDNVEQRRDHRLVVFSHQRDPAGVGPVNRDSPTGHGELVANLPDLKHHRRERRRVGEHHRPPHPGAAERIVHHADPVPHVGDIDKAQVQKGLAVGDPRRDRRKPFVIQAGVLLGHLPSKAVGQRVCLLGVHQKVLDHINLVHLEQRVDGVARVNSVRLYQMLMRLRQ